MHGECVGFLDRRTRIIIGAPIEGKPCPARRSKGYDAGEMMLAAAGALLCLAVILGVVGLRALRTFVRSLWPH